MFRGLVLCIAIVALCFSAAAQTATGVLQGRVSDSSGAVVPEAKILIQNEDTGIKFNVASNADGNFIQSFLLPGNYQVTVEKAGFQKYFTSHIKVAVGQSVSLEISLKVGELTTTVEVESTGVQLSTSSSTISTVISTRPIMDLPLNGRNVMSLVNLTPGTMSQNGASTPWISGGRNGTSEITVDGTSIILPENNVSINQTSYTPIVDSVAEFAVITNALSAEYGRTGGGAVNIATRGGQNALHGSGYDFLQNSKLNANSWSNNRNKVKKNPYQNNWFGGTIGGPVWIPGLYDGRNRTFFFFSEQSNRSRTMGSSTSTVPLQEWRDGNFANLRDGSGNLIIVYDPATGVANANGSGAIRQAFPGNVIPSIRFDPISKNMLKYWPQPNNVPTNPYTQAGNYYMTGKGPSNDDKFDSRIDHNFSEKLRMFARGSYDYSNSGIFNYWGADNVGSSAVRNDGPNVVPQYNITTNWIYTLNSTTILNFNVAFSHFNGHRVPASEGTCPASLGFPGYLDAEVQTQNCEFPSVSVGSFAGFGQAQWTTLFNKPTAYNFKSDLTKIFSNHSLKIGAEGRKMFMNFTQHGYPAGSYSFSQGWTQQDSTAGTSTTKGAGIASFLLGNMSGSSITHSMDIATASTYWGLYFQDDWKVSPNLTLNIGARWEMDVPRTERYNRLSYFDFNAPSPLGTSVAVPAGVNCPGCSHLQGAMKFVGPGGAYGRHQTPADINNIGPRIGFAYKLTGSTVFRGAYGMMYAGSMLQAAGTSGSAGTEGFTSTTNQTLSFDNNVTAAATFKNPFPNGFALPLGRNPGPYSGALTNIGLGVGESFFSDNSNPVIQQWNATLQHEVSRLGMLFEVGYMASKGNHLIDGENMQYNQTPDQYIGMGTGLNTRIANPFNGVILQPTSAFYNQPTIQTNRLLTPYPQYTSINAYRKPGANSNYQSLIAKAEKRYANGMSFLASLTLGKLLDDASTTVNFLGSTGSKQDYYNRKAEKSVSVQDVSRQLVGSFEYELPFGKRGHFLTMVPKPVDFIIGGWHLNGIYTYRTAQPLQIGNGGNSIGLQNAGTLRANSNGVTAKKSGAVGDRITQYFDTSAFYQAPNYTFGSLGRTSPNLRGPSYHGMDASMFKDFRFREKVTVQFRADMFNFANHPVWSGPNTTVTSTGVNGFGTITSKSGSRTVQMNLRVSF
jgi:hypothetical protein